MFCLVSAPNNLLYAQEDRDFIAYNKINSCKDHVYDGIREVYLGYSDVVYDRLTRDNYREYDRFLIYDQGIIKSWSSLSNPYFIISIAKGISYEKSKNITAVISGSISGNFPSGAKSSIFKAFDISASGSKSVTEKVVFSGPNNSYSTRDFYYKKGTHKHSVKVVQEHMSNWDGVLWTKTFNVNVEVPAIKIYSEDH